MLNTTQQKIDITVQAFNGIYFRSKIKSSPLKQI